MNPSLWAWLSLGGVVLPPVAVIWSIRGHRDPILKIHSASAVDQLIPTFAGLTLSTPLAGNSVEVLENGAYCDVLLEHIRSATDPCISRPFRGRKAHWVAVWRARSPSGSRGLAGARAAGRQRLARRAPGHPATAERAGCTLVFFHDGAFRNIGVLTDRDHRKLVVFDGREAFVGGHCIVDSRTGGLRSSP